MRRTTIEGDSCGELKGITRTFFSSPCENRSMRLSNPLVRSLRRPGTILKTRNFSLELEPNVDHYEVMVNPQQRVQVQVSGTKCRLR